MRSLLATGALAAALFLAGCHSSVPGEPRADPTEPSFSTSRATPTTPVTPPTATAAPAPPAEALAPQDGYVFIQTKSGQTRCQISTQEVGCEAQFANPPTVDGGPANGVRLTADGQEQWVLGNLGAIPAVTLDYRSYTAEGWTIDATEAGTTFVNVATGHGMFVAIDAVNVF